MHAHAVTAAAVAALGAAVLLSPDSSSDARFVRAAQPTVIAHRGASAYAPENTLAAIDKAAKLGFSWVENDVQRTKDGRLVVIHDDNLARTTNVEDVFPGRAPWKVKDFTSAEIAKLDAGSWFSPDYAGARVPTLERYMRQVERNHEKLLLEVKNPELYPGIEAQILKTLSNEGWLNGTHRNRLIVQSFSADSLRTVHQLKPALTTGYLGRPAEDELSGYARFTDLINPSYADISASYVSNVHALKGPHGKHLRLFTWTVNDAATARQVRDYGVDGIITNKPDVVRTALSTS
ncbi:glycerophosphodiester phosphodiesterase family protein [Streptomyces sp. SID4982]|uniref:glycerophosphodiester phosphodiesterase n=1 Tax=Streptomyces sp. SID4982 TaxID=2690291 RepID=UPI0013687C27|nr:glycerophosphodiester phosphodiesterase family protein [Streptomyces sp. SID4982]MYS17597.1 glycerophosphodiester phosphodiesterase [Streptomyces sp. SID4982]